jgi:hypothetical protein
MQRKPGKLADSRKSSTRAVHKIIEQKKHAPIDAEAEGKVALDLDRAAKSNSKHVARDVDKNVEN